MVAGTWFGEEDISMVQVIVNARAVWTDDQKQALAVAITQAFRNAVSLDGEVSVWFEGYEDRDVYVGAEVAAKE
jgi:phenylpyruvate tautomerase PptA (4-oxalocrotonate tautomerase family)